MIIISTLLCATMLYTAQPKQFPQITIKKPVISQQLHHIEVKAEEKPQATNMLANPRIPTDDFLWFNPGKTAPLSAHSGQAIRISYNPETQSLTTAIVGNDSALFRHFYPLSDSEQSSLDGVPGWIKPRLTMTLSYIEGSKRAALLSFIKDVTTQYKDEEFLDELFFPMAWSSPEELTVEDFSPLIFLKNAQTIYTSARQLPYATLNEKSETDRHTTLTLKTVKEGNDHSWELSAWDYYMFVVHPRLDAEPYQLIAPYSGLPDTEKWGGTDWRTGIWEGTPYRKSYVTHRLLETPYIVIEEELQSGKIPCYQQFSFENAPLSIISGERGSCLAEVAFNNKGTLIISSLPEDFSKEKLLKNMVGYGKNGGQYKTVTIITEDGTIPANIQDIYEHTVNVDHLSSVSTADFTVEHLFVQPQDAESPVRAIDKVIIPLSDKTAVYKMLSDNKLDFETFLNLGGTLEIHVGKADLAGLTLPTGITAVAGKESLATDITGHPLFATTLTAATYAWDYQTYIRYGETPLHSDETAFSRAGFWGGKNLPLNVAERREAELKVERSSQAIRVAYNHYGNCGENQDLLIASMRTALLPVAGAHDSGEDHVWVEFFTGEKWIPMQTMWSDTSFDVDQLGRICMETKWNDYKGGKDISFIGSWRGDNALFNHTTTYTDSVTLTLTVTDKNGLPADGTMILLATENYYDHAQLTVAGYGVTDKNGLLTTEVGDRRNIYILAKNKVLGGFPDGGSVAQVIKAEEALPGKKFSASLALPGSTPQLLEQPTIVEKLFESEENTNSLDIHAVDYAVHTSPYGDRTVLLTYSEPIQALLFADKNGDKWLKGEKTEAQSLMLDNALTALPAERAWEILIPVDGTSQRILAYASLVIEETPDEDTESVDSVSSASSKGCAITLLP
ncbi:hypothetical protein KAH37_02975 [bacterium]|nr:hypothetical protein [bacterium]